jgi:hypothetical protein
MPHFQPELTPELSANSRETSIPGLLTITDQGVITLAMEGSLSAPGDGTDWSIPQLPESRRIGGYLASPSNDYVLLEGIERLDFFIPGDFSEKQEFKARTCIRREFAFPLNHDEGSLVELRIPLAGMEKWLKLESIETETEYDSGDKECVKVSYKECNLQFAIDGGTLSIESITTGGSSIFGGLSLRGERWLRQRVLIEQTFYLVFKPETPSARTHLLYMYVRLEEFLALLTGFYQTLEWPIVVRKERDSFDQWDTVYYNREPRRDQEFNEYYVWVEFKDIREDFGLLFREWLNGYEECGPGYYLYLSLISSPHVYREDRFLNLVCGIEALHRKWLGEPETSERVIKEKERVKRILALLEKGSSDYKWLKWHLAHAHEPSLQARISECLQQLPLSFEKETLEQFAKACADRRNDISHVGGARDGMDYGEFVDQIGTLAEALDYLFHALVLHKIGLKPELIVESMTGERTLAYRAIRPALEAAGLRLETPVI